MQPEGTQPNENINPEPSNNVNPTPQPATATGGPVIPDPFKSDEPVQPGKSKRKIPAALFIAGLAVLLLGGGAAAYFGVIATNKPESIWARALDNTNKGYDKLVDYMKETKDTKDYSLDGDFKFDAASVVVDGSVKGKVGEKNADVSIDIGAAGSRVNLNMLMNIPDNSTYPDIYVKATGLQGISQLLGGQGSEAGSILAAFENQWYAIDHTLFEQLEKQTAATNTSGAANFTSDDLIAVSESVGKVNAEYLFSDDKDKAVLKLAESVGKESLDGRSAYHFKVGYNKENLKKYVTALKDELKKTKIVELVPNKDLEKALNFDEMIKGIDELEGNGTADAWVDMDTKLIRKVRFTEENKTENYVDLILNYNGGDEYPFLVAFHDIEGSTETNMSVGLNLNTKQDTAEYTLDIKTTGANPVTGNAKFKLSPSSEKIEFKKPEGAKPLTDLLGGLMGGQLQGGVDQSSLEGLDQLEL